MTEKEIKEKGTLMLENAQVGLLVMMFYKMSKREVVIEIAYRNSVENDLSRQVMCRITGFVAENYWSNFDYSQTFGDGSAASAEIVHEQYLDDTALGQLKAMWTPQGINQEHDSFGAWVKRIWLHLIKEERERFKEIYPEETQGLSLE